MTGQSTISKSRLNHLRISVEMNMHEVLFRVVRNVHGNDFFLNLWMVSGHLFRVDKVEAAARTHLEYRVLSHTETGYEIVPKRNQQLKKSKQFNYQTLKYNAG